MKASIKNKSWIQIQTSVWIVNKELGVIGEAKDTERLKRPQGILFQLGLLLSGLGHFCDLGSFLSNTFSPRFSIKLNQFYLRCLRKIAGIKWQDRTTNVEVLQICKISGMEALLM